MIVRPRLAVNDVDLAKLGVGHAQLERLFKARLITVGDVLLRLNLSSLVLRPRHTSESEKAQANPRHFREGH